MHMCLIYIPNTYKSIELKEKMFSKVAKMYSAKEGWKLLNYYH